MLKELTKLSRKFLILAVLSGSLVFALGLQTRSTKAFLLPNCCWECDELSLVCEEVCETHPQQCNPCRHNVALCYAQPCDPSPTCT
ncbi:MAG TPA: hypothetical protein VGO50_17865 [Pyrinomonadaceae bacterium]|jgi:hypothetical protein|nr:hypothetical protein [Pyrinomonadaceae bacterium]